MGPQAKSGFHRRPEWLPVCFGASGKRGSVVTSRLEFEPAAFLSKASALQAALVLLTARPASCSAIALQPGTKPVSPVTRFCGEQDQNPSSIPVRRS